MNVHQLQGDVLIGFDVTHTVPLLFYKTHFYLHCAQEINCLVVSLLQASGLGSSGYSLKVNQFCNPLNPLDKN